MRRLARVFTGRPERILQEPVEVARKLCAGDSTASASRNQVRFLLYFARSRQVASRLPFTTPDFLTIARRSVSFVHDGRLLRVSDRFLKPQNYIFLSKTGTFSSLLTHELRLRVKHGPRRKLWSTPRLTASSD